jgi:hypothetical protein
VVVLGIEQRRPATTHIAVIGVSAAPAHMAPSPAAPDEFMPLPCIPIPMKGTFP